MYLNVNMFKSVLSFLLSYCQFWASQMVLVVKNSPVNAVHLRDVGSISGSGTSTGGGQGNILQYFCLENPHGQRSLAGYSH